MRWCCRPVQWYFFTWSSPLLLLPRLFGGVYMMELTPAEHVVLCVVCLAGCCGSFKKYHGHAS